MNHKPGDTVTVKTKGKPIRRAEIIYISEDRAVWQFLNVATMKAEEYRYEDIEVLPFSPHLFKEYCKCAKPAPKPHPNGKDIYCSECNLTLKI